MTREKTMEKTMNNKDMAKKLTDKILNEYVLLKELEEALCAYEEARDRYRKAAYNSSELNKIKSDGYYNTVTNYKGYNVWVK